MGFGTKKESKLDDSTLSYISPLDIKNFGLIPEIIGRLPVITYLDKLSKEDLMQILTKPKNALIKQYQKLFQIDNIELNITLEACMLIVEKTIELNLGARGLRSIFEKILLQDSFIAPSKKSLKKILIDHDYILNKMGIEDFVKKAS